MNTILATNTKFAPKTPAKSCKHAAILLTKFYFLSIYSDQIQTLHEFFVQTAATNESLYIVNFTLLIIMMDGKR